MIKKTERISSGINGLNRILNGLFIGDNVVWYDDAGSLAAPFYMRFIEESQNQNKPIIYVSFDRSPKNLIERLGPLAENQHLTILDCFTNGKGDKAQIFNKFYEKNGAQWPYQIIKVTRPQDPKAVGDAIYGLHKTLTGDVRFVFESLTGMADLWEGEEHILKFYSHTCPQLYELDTIAYWIIETKAHSDRIKAHINQVAQVAIALSMDQGKTKIQLLKAEKRSSKVFGKSFFYAFENNDLIIEGKKDIHTLYDLGSAIKNFRKKLGISQKELSKLVGVTPSNISQIESNQVFPSIPTLYKLADHLSIDVGSFFKHRPDEQQQVFLKSDAVFIQAANGNKDRVEIQQLTPFDLDGKIDISMITIFPGKKLSTHFFKYKGAEAGFLISGSLEMSCQEQQYRLGPGDTVYLKSENPSRWVNKEDAPARLLWIKIK